MNNLIVLPYKKKWAVLEEHNSRLSSVHRTAGAAIDAALRRRRHDPSAVSDKEDLQPRILGSKSFLQLPKYQSELIVIAKSIKIKPKRL